MSSVKKHVERERFFASVMLGRLAKWLRILGYDTLYEREIEESHLLEICLSEDRILLTRNSALLRPNTKATVLFLDSEKPLKQLRQLLDLPLIVIDRELMFTRCSHCNSLLIELNKAEVKGQVPPYVFSSEEVFLSCPDCAKIYWRGTHGDRFLKMISSIIK